MTNEKDMPFGRKMKINLKKVVPTKVTASDLKKELNSIGLTCAHTEEKHLEQYIQEVVSSFSDGKYQGFGTYKFRPSQNMDMALLSGRYKNSKEFLDAVATKLDINNEWEMIDTGQEYATDLTTITNSENFDFLCDNCPDFPGNKGTQTDNKETTTPAAVKETFRTIANSMASALVEGVTPKTMESFLAHILQPITEETEDYCDANGRYMYLVKGYDPDKQECDAVGAISCDYEISIGNYKDKKTKHIKSHIQIVMRSFVSSDPQEIAKWAQYVIDHKPKKQLQRMMPIHSEIKVFDSLPEPSKDVFSKSVPLESKNDTMSALVLYSPDLENIGVFDNSDSNVTSQYSKTVTSGFMFSTSEKIGSNVSCEIGCQFAKVGVSINMEMSMTEQWNETQSETISFNVPGRQKAYLYQCYIHAAVLHYDLNTFKYYYETSGRFLTNMVKTSDKSLIDK